MPAKDVLDLQVSVADLHDADRRFDPVLTGLGIERADTVADHVPVGQIDDLAGWSKRLWWRSAAPGRAVNLHVRLVGSPNDRLALLFRDWFRSHPAGVPAYGECKTPTGRPDGGRRTLCRGQGPRGRPRGQRGRGMGRVRVVAFLTPCAVRREPDPVRRPVVRYVGHRGGAAR